MAGIFSGSSEQQMLEELLGGGPDLEDFVSNSPQDLPSFDHATRSDQAGENRMEYAIFVDKTPGEPHGPEPTGADFVELQAVRASILAGAVSDLRDVSGKSTSGNGAGRQTRLVTQHLWQSEAFEISEPNPGDDGLRGSMHFGDCIDDEWLVVWLLLNATKRDSRLSVTVRDNDGEFILIETSPAWPPSLDWLDPDCSENRVWLRGGHLHILDASGDEGKTKSPTRRGLERGPLPLGAGLQALRGSEAGSMVELVGLASRADLNGRLGRTSGDVNPKTGRLAVELCPVAGGDLGSASAETVRVRPENVRPALHTAEVEAARRALSPPLARTTAPPALRSLLDSRLAAARNAAATNRQRVHMVLPAQLAFLLYHRPNLASRAVAAFYLREPGDAAAAVKAHRFGPPATSRGRTNSGPFAGAAKSLAPIKVTVSMTRCLHAQLEQQGSAFAPPQHLANAWKTHLAARGGEVLDSQLSPSAASAWPEESDLQLEETSVDASSFERGLRLTSAFEMLYQASRRSTEEAADASRVQVVPDDTTLLRLPLGDISTAIDAAIAVGDTLNWEKLGSGDKDETAVAVADSKKWLACMLQEPIDGDGWMDVSPEEMESMLRQSAPPPIPVQEASTAAEEEVEDLQAGAQKLQGVVEGVHRFLDGSGEAAGGAELPKTPGNADSATNPVSFDLEKFMGLLGGGDRNSSSDAGDNLFNDDDSVDDGSDGDSGDDNGGNGTGGERDVAEGELELEEEDALEEEAEKFTGAYYDHMDRELDGSEIISKSFERQATVADEPTSDSPSTSGALPAYSSKSDPTEESGQGDRGVDLDANLVKHLLESFASQEGLAGPASNLLQEMGTFFPAQGPRRVSHQGPASQPPLSPRSPQPQKKAASGVGTRAGSTVEFMYELD